MDDTPGESTDGTTRRQVLAAAGASSAAGVAAALYASGVAAEPQIPETVTTLANGDGTGEEQADRDVFPQSVASGGPTSGGVIVWTRIDPEHVTGGARPRLTVWPDGAPASGFELTLAAPAAQHDYTIQVDLDGKLDPDRFYNYQFQYRDASSPVGRCRTLPEAETGKQNLSLALATCNNYLQGLFPAYSHIADEDVDYLVHLGDFIYESGGDGAFGRSIQLPSGHTQAWTLDDFRTLHRTYRGDRHMQNALETHTLIHTWDDHEIVNNRWWNYEVDAPATASHPKGDDPAFMKLLYARGIQALTEYLPLRVDYDDEPPFDQDSFTLYRSFRFGNLAELFMTDERLYRTPPPEDALGQRDFATPPSEAQDDPGRWMLGSEQRDWLISGVTESPATWKLWGNEVLNLALKLVNAGEDAVYINYDAWDGYEHERETIMGAFHTHGVENLVTVTGDMHTYLVGYLKRDYKDATESEHATDAGRVGVELMTPAISSHNLVDSGLFPPARREQEFDQGAQTQNPHIEWINSNNYGYAVVDITPTGCTYTAYAVDRSEDDPAAAGKELLRKFHVPVGDVELKEVEGDAVPEADSSDARDEAGIDTTETSSNVSETVGETGISADGENSVGEPLD